MATLARATRAAEPRLTRPGVPHDARAMGTSMRLGLLLTAMALGCSTPTSSADPDTSTRDGGADDSRAPDAGPMNCDLDRDGHDSMNCGGDDCDDADANRHPGNAEVCDAASHDEDCDASTFGDRDADGDGAVDAACCNVVLGTTHCGDDCDDAAAAVRPGSTEACDAIDNDCDLAVDEGVLVTFGADCDADGFAGAPQAGCSTPSTPPPSCPGGSWITVLGDCDDTDAARNPDASEICDGVDDDCSGTADDGDASVWCAGAGMPPNIVGESVCLGGACSTPMCLGDYLDCDSAPGCEADGASDLTHCGDCATTCGWSCSQRACVEATAISVAGANGCVIRSPGDVACWGGQGAVSGSQAIHLVSGITDAVQLSVGPLGGCAMVAGSGTPRCWGSNEWGQLGDGTISGRANAAPVSGLSDATQVSVGGFICGGCGPFPAVGHACARRATGQVACWGSNDFGELTGATGPASRTPITVAGMNDIVEVAAGARHTCARTTAGTVRCWGQGFGVGDGSTSGIRPPTVVPGIDDATRLVASGTSTCVLRGAGRVSCWGSEFTLTPTTFTGVDGATELAVGIGSVCVRRTSGAITCWGANSHGTLGDGTMMVRTVSSPAIPVLDASHVSMGGDAAAFACGIRSNGEVLCWGQNLQNSLGDGTTIDHAVPARVTPL